MEKIPGTEKRTERGRKGGGINHERKEEIKSSIETIKKEYEIKNEKDRRNDREGEKLKI